MSSPASNGRKQVTPLQRAFSAFRPALIATVIFSVFCNILLFVGPLYMLQIYDRVLSSRSVGTLVALTAIGAAMLLVYSLLDVFRSRMLVRAGVRFDQLLNQPLYKTMLNTALVQRGLAPAQSLRDMDTVREFWTGQGVLTLCDAPFAPLFVAICFLFHPYLGLVALGGAVVLFLLALINELVTRRTLTEAGRVSVDAANYATASLHNIEAIHALGMQDAIHKRWSERHKDVLGFQAQASDRAATILSASKFVRQFLQMLILGVGAYLAIQREISPGIMIAASIMMGRALQPVEQAVGQWKQLMGARNSWRRLVALFEAMPEPPPRIALPKPKGAIQVENVLAPAPGRQIAILKNVSFGLEAGRTLVIRGDSGAGKSTLARTLVGVWPVANGAVRLDGADLRHWNKNKLGEHIGYLPQDVELFSGTVAENIARFRDCKDEEVIEASQLAGAHEMILGLPDGYETQIGEGGVALSGGQRQRIGLARAVFGNPCLVVLDEPNAHLDETGEHSLLTAIARLKQRGTTVVLITHKESLIAVADEIVWLKDGMIAIKGPREQVMAEIAAARQARQLPQGARRSPGPIITPPPQRQGAQLARPAEQQPAAPASRAAASESAPAQAASEAASTAPPKEFGFSVRIAGEQPTDGKPAGKTLNGTHSVNGTVNGTEHPDRAAGAAPAATAKSSMGGNGSHGPAAAKSAQPAGEVAELAESAPAGAGKPVEGDR